MQRVNSCVVPRKSISYETGESCLRSYFVKEAYDEEHAGTVEQIEQMLKSHGKAMKRGSLYNLLSKLQSQDYELIKSKRTYNEKVYWLNPQVDSMTMLSCGVRTSRFGFSDFERWVVLGGAGVHDVRLYTRVGLLDFVDKDWKHYPKRCLYQRNVVEDGVRVWLQARYGKGQSLMMIVACANEPFSSDLIGVRKLMDVVKRVRLLYCNSAGVPAVGDWIVKGRHYGKDGKNTFKGSSFECTFNSYTGEMLRVYTRPTGVRLEMLQNPNKKLGELLFEEEAKQENARLIDEELRRKDKIIQKILQLSNETHRTYVVRHVRKG